MAQSEPGAGAATGDLAGPARAGHRVDALYGVTIVRAELVQPASDLFLPSQRGWLGPLETRIAVAGLAAGGLLLSDAATVLLWPSVLDAARASAPHTAAERNS